MLNIVNRYLIIKHLHICKNMEYDDHHHCPYNRNYLFINYITVIYYRSVSPTDAYKKYFFKK